MARVFITGGAGFIGSHVTRKLLDAGHEVFIYDMMQQFTWPLPTTFFGNMQYRFAHLLGKATIIHGGMHEVWHLRSTLEALKPTHILHLASLSVAAVALRRREEALRSILNSTFSILNAAMSLTGLQNLVYVSSSMAYGHFENVPMPETGRMNPVGIYGCMKLSGELLTRVYAYRHEVPAVIVRPSAVYGPADNNRRVIQIMVEKALYGRPITLFNPLTTKLDFTYVEDTADGMILALFCDPVHRNGRAYNITRGGGRSLHEAEEILRRCIPSVEVEHVHKTDINKPVRGALDISRARTELGYDPKWSLENGMSKYIAWVRDVHRLS